MDGCVICQHPKHDAIMETLRGKKPVGLTAYYFRVEKMALVQHCQHEPIGAIIEPVNDSRQAPAETPGQPPTSSADHPEPLIYPMTPSGERTPEGDELTPLAVLKQGLPYVRRAVALAGADRAMQEQLVMVLNHALAEAALGL